VSNTGTSGYRNGARIGLSGTCVTVKGTTVGEWLCTTDCTSERSL
jgi:hypothetical protein